MREGVGLAALVWLVAGVVVPTQEAGSATPAAVQVFGTLKIQVNFLASASLPNGTAVSISPYASVYDATYTDTSYIYTSVNVANNKVVATLTIPYKWLVTSSSDKISLSLSASANGSNATGTLYNSTNYSRTIPIPANGATTTVSFLGAI